jgi:hypothetical protein
MLSGDAGMIALLMILLILVILLVVCRRMKANDEQFRDFERYLWIKYLERGNRR